jgi:Ca2+-binding RTX toxin-like protein
VLVALSSVALAGVVGETQRFADLSGGTASAATKTTVVNRGVCDVDGVRVAYGTTYQHTAPAGYRVTTATVSGLDSACRDAQLSVQLSGGTMMSADPTGRAVVQAGTTSSTVAIPRTPLAEWVRQVTVTLEGGRLPLPQACRGPYSRSFLGTTGDDPAAALTGTNQDDALFGLDGDDTYDALNGDDCVVAGDGDSRILLGNGADVVVAGNGANRIISGSGAGNDGDTVVLGDGDNVVELGNNGGNTVRVGRGSSTLRLGNGANAVAVKGRTGGLTMVEAGHGSVDLTLAAGAAVVRLQGGDRSELRFGAGDERVYLLGGKNSVVHASAGITTCYVPLSVRKQNDLRGCTTVVLP